MSQMIQISDKSYTHILTHASNLQVQENRRITLKEALDDIIDNYK